MSQPQWVHDQAELLRGWVEENKPGRYRLIEELRRRGLPSTQYRAKRLLDFLSGSPSDWKGRKDAPEAPARVVAKGKPSGLPATPTAASYSQSGGAAEDTRRELICKLPGQVTCLEDLMDAAGVDTDTWYAIDHVVNRWESANGKGEVTPLWQVKARMARNLLSRLERAPKFEVPPPAAAPSRDVEIALILPDTQTGFTWGDNYKKLIPYHDRRAIEAARLLCAYLKPNKVLWVGDDLDLEELSTKFVRDPEASQTVQPAIDERAFWLSQFVMAAPAAEHLAGDGNHEARLKRNLQEKAPWAVHLRRPGEKYPALSVPSLLGLADLGVTWLGEYGWEYNLWDEVMVHHGTKVAAGGGATVARVVKDALHSSVQGHIHHLELAYRSLWGLGGRSTVFAMSPGCLCRTDGIVPGSDKPDWQQGVGILYRDVKTGKVTGTTVEIVDGRIVYEGRVFEATDRTPEIAQALGYPQMVPGGC